MPATPEQLHEMLKHCMDFARTMLEDSGDFYPFGATLSLNGVVAAVGGYNGKEVPVPSEIYKLLGQAFLDDAARGEHAGVALAANVNVPAEYSSTFPDGLRVHLESHGYARLIYVPYKITTQGLLKKRRVADVFIVLGMGVAFTLLGLLVSLPATAYRFRLRKANPHFQRRMAIALDAVVIATIVIPLLFVLYTHVWALM